MATSQQHASIDAREEVTLETNTPIHFTLSMDQVVAGRSDVIDLTVDAQIVDQAVGILRIMPDDSSIAAVDFSTEDSVSHTFGLLKEHCPDNAPCSLGFTLELIEGEGPLDVHLVASAVKEDSGSMCEKRPSDYDEDANFTIVLDQ